MATVNLGSIKFKWKGTYSGATAYTVDDVVSYNGSSYICILASTGNLPTNATYFEQMSQAGTNGTDLTSTLTTQGDLLYRDGSGLVRLGAGTAGQVLQTGGAGANPSWVDASGGTVLGFSSRRMTTHISFASSSPSSYTYVGDQYITYTPVSSSSKILVQYNPHIYSNNTGTNWENMRANLYYNYSTSSPTSPTSVHDWVEIRGHDYSSTSMGVWDRSPEFAQYLHTHATPSTESITYKVYLQFHNASTMTWHINGGNVSSGVISVWELDI
jgi:hypothetical protein